MLFKEIMFYCRAGARRSINEVIRKSFPNRGLGQSLDIPTSRRCSQDSSNHFFFFAPTPGYLLLLRNLPCLRLCVILIFLCFLTGCHQSKTDEAQFSSTAEKDGISLTISRTQKTLTTVELLRLTLDVEAPQGSDFYFPNEETDFGDFTYFESHISSMKLNAENKVEQKYTLVLEPGLPGSHTVPVLTVQYGQKSVASEPVKVEVNSILPTEQTEVRDITPLTAPAGLKWLFILGVLVAILFLDSVLIKDGSKEETVEFGTEALNKLSKASLAEIPKIFCKFLSKHFNQQVAYTGTESLVKYLMNQKIDSALISEIETTLRKYEESRFANQEEESLCVLTESFSGLIQKLEGKV